MTCTEEEETNNHQKAKRARNTHGLTGFLLQSHIQCHIEDPARFKMESFVALVKGESP